MEKEKTKRKFKWSVPHTYVIVAILILVATLTTYVVPAGEFDRMEDEVTGRTIVVADSYHLVDPSPVSLFEMFKAVERGMVESGEIIFFIFFAYGFVYMLIKSGSLNGAIGWMLRRLKGADIFLIPIFMLFFGIAGSTFGMYEETYGLIPAFIGIAIALGYDGIVGGAIVVVGVATGFAAATTNPFTIGIAQGIAELPISSGVEFRAIAFVVFMTAVIIYTMRYAIKVKNRPELSIVRDVEFKFAEGVLKDDLMQIKFTLRHKLSILLFFITLVLVFFGTKYWGWYLEELSALFIIMMILAGLLGGYNFSKIAEYFVEAVSEVVFGALVIGIARAATIVLEDGHVIDTVVYNMANVVAHTSGYVAAWGMLVVQNLINFFIPSGSGQAAVSMPIMTPIADAIGMNRQIAVTAFQFGDGFSNLFWPTAVATECGLMGIPISKWYKFMAPLFGIMLILEVIFMAIAVAINYGPF